MKVITRSGTVHYGTPSGRGTVMPDCGPRGRQTAGSLANDNSDVTCKSCQKQHSTTQCK